MLMSLCYCQPSHSTFNNCAYLSAYACNKCLSQSFQYFICFILGAQKGQPLYSVAKKFLAYFTVYFGLIAVAGSTPLESPEQQAYSAFEELVTDFSKRNCSLNSKIFMTLENYYRQELNCSTPQLCHQCEPCQPCICEFCGSNPLVIIS